MKKFLVVYQYQAHVEITTHQIKMILIKNQKRNQVKNLMTLIRIKISQKRKIKRKKMSKNLLMKKIKIARNNLNKLTLKSSNKLKNNNKRNKTMSMIAQNTVTNIMLVTRFQLMTIGHQKKNNALNKVHNKVLKEMVMILIIHI